MRKHNKAFTLTELLVVVIVIGVLAAVAVPKMRQMLDARKTTEAENVLSAVRTEQEHRCMLGNAYWQTGEEDKVTMLSSVKNANYTYTLTNTGARATEKGNKYILQMPSYKTGEICCSGSGCADLNKDYTSCSDVVIPADECAGEPDEEISPEIPSCDNSHVEGVVETGTCTCGGSKTENWMCINGTWNLVASTDCTPCACPSDGHTEGRTYTGTCECGGEAYEDWHCGEDTGWVWNLVDQSSCSECSCSIPSYKTAHKNICCPSAPKEDTTCWIRKYAWGAQKKISASVTARWNAGPTGMTDNRCVSYHTSWLAYTTVTPDAGDHQQCPGSYSSASFNANKGQACGPNHTPSGAELPVCLYGGVPLQTVVDAGAHPTLESGWNGDQCVAQMSSWWGHECEEVAPEKNGW